MPETEKNATELWRKNWNSPLRQLTVVIPAYNEEAVLMMCYQRVTSVLRNIEEKVPGLIYSILYVNDGSKDDTGLLLASLCERDRHVQAVMFARNFGHQPAVTAGMDYAVKDGADVVAIMDCDLQDPPEVLEQMLEKWAEGYDVVYGQRNSRAGETKFKTFTASAFYRILNKVTGLNMPVDTGDFRLMDRKVCEVMSSMREHDRYLRGMSSWVGFRSCGVRFDRDARAAGETKYPLKKQLKLALNGILSFSYAPMWWIITGGVVALLTGLVMLIVSLFAHSGLLALAGFVALCTGLLADALGAVGLYVGRIYEESKNRPLYIVAETRNLNR